MIHTPLPKSMITVVCFFLLSCNASRHNKEGIQSAMNQYDHYIQTMDVDSIALLFTPDGDLGKMAHGRDSIKNFLNKFKSFKVLSQSSATQSINKRKDSTIQKGLYHQTVIVPVNDTVMVKGEYTATWVWLSKNGWRIKRMETNPIK